MGFFDWPVWRHALWSLLLYGLATVPVVAQQAKPKDKDAAPVSAIKLPSGAIIVVTNDLDSIDKSAGIYLTPERYKALNDQIELLKKQVAAEKPLSPSSCELDGRIVERGTQKIVRLSTTFRFRTVQPRSVIFLGCQKMQAVEAKLEEGKLPLLAATEKGLSVLVEDSGDHVLRLELESALRPRGAKSNEIGFETSLPGAPITSLIFMAPPKVQRVTLSRREVSTAPMFSAPLVETALDVKRVDVKRLQREQGGEALGAITFLAVSWDDESRIDGRANEKSAEADVQVTIGDVDIVSEARLRLKGAAKEWWIVAPSNAELSVGRAPASAGGKSVEFPLDQTPDIVRPEPGQSIWRIRFQESNANDLLAIVTVRATRPKVDPKAKSGWPVGPFAVVDVPQQSGVIRIKSLPHLKVVSQLKGDTQRLDSGDDPTADALFRYRSLPVGPNGIPTVPLELDIRAASGVIQTRVNHQLRMADGGWRLHTEIIVVPIRMEVELLEVEVPTAVVFEAVTPKLVESVSAIRENGPLRRVVQVKLATSQRTEFSVALEGFYPLPVGTQEMTVVFPRVLNALDRAGQLTIAVPEGYDLRGSAYQWEINGPGIQPHALEPASAIDKAASLSANLNRTLSHVDLIWKAQRSDVRVESQIDVVLHDQDAHATHTMRLTFADRVPNRLRIRASAAVTGVSVKPGALSENGPLDWTVNLPADTGKETTIVFNYAFPLPADLQSDSLLSVPLFWPDATNWHECRVRIWRDRRASRLLVPVVDGLQWEQQPPDLVSNEQSLPLLVIHSSAPSAPLTLRMIEPVNTLGRDVGMGATVTVWIERALIQAHTSGTFQHYRARFFLSRWSARSFDVALPAGAINADVLLNGVSVSLRENNANSDSLRGLSVVLPVWRPQTQALMEVSYHLASGRQGGFNGVITEWQPPRLPDGTAVSLVRWQVSLPDNSVPISLDGSASEERWALRNFIAQPVAAHSSAELEKWLYSGQTPDGDESATSLTCRQGGLTPLRIAALPRPIFIVAVSLLVLALGLLLARLPKRAVGVLLALSTTGVIIAGLLWPQPFGQVLSASQPGLALLALILGLQHGLLWRYRRRLTRMPGFARIRVESAIARSNGKQIPRETATIDTPAAT